MNRNEKKETKYICKKKTYKRISKWKVDNYMYENKYIRKKIHKHEKWNNEEVNKVKKRK